MYVCIYVCPSRLGMLILIHCARISVSCMLHVRGVRKGCGRTIVVNVASNTKNVNKTMHVDAMDGLF